MANAIYGFDEGGNQLFPAISNSSLDRSFVANFGPNLTVTRGQAVGRKTSDGKMYALNTAASDGTQTFAGFSMYSLSTDGSGNTYLNVASGTSDYFTTAYPVGTIWTGGIFDPNQLYTQPVTSTTAVAEIDTATPTGVTVALDTWGIYNPAGIGFTVVATTTTVAAAITAMVEGWNANADAKALAVASGSSTVLTLTGVTPGKSLNLTSTVGSANAGSFAPVFIVATPATTGVVAEVDTFTPTSVTTGDVTTVTITYPNLQTHAVTAAAIGGTANATTWTTAMKAAWNADPQAVAYATATGTTTFILTGVNVGQGLSLAAATVGTGTVAKVVTTPAFGRNIADILPGAPGSRVLQPTGFWQIC